MPRILLIDDDQLLRTALRLSIEKSGYEVVEAGDGREGLAAYRAGRFELVVTDMVMPGMEGVETIGELRKLDPRLPIIAISGGGRGAAGDYLSYAKIFGASIMLEKPLEPELLCAAIVKLIGPPDRTAPTNGG